MIAFIVTPTIYYFPKWFFFGNQAPSQKGNGWKWIFADMVEEAMTDHMPNITNAMNQLSGRGPDAPRRPPPSRRC